MENIKNIISSSDNDKLKEAFLEELKDPDFKELVSYINCDTKKLYKYRSSIKDSSVEYKNCKTCKSLKNCKNSLTGYLYFPEYKDDELLFSYVPCKYKKEDIKKNAYLDNIELFESTTMVKTAKMKDIFVDDKSRIEVIKAVNSFYENYFKEPKKGIYLSGNFGSGKTYIIAALFNELAKKGVKSSIVYFPEFLRVLKASFAKEDYLDKFEYIKKTPLLLIDDIGAEQVTSWGRDEILGTILQYRMEENLPTFFTSNFNIKELEEHLSSTKEKIEKLKARRIIERINYLCDEMFLIGVDRRKQK